MCAGRAREIKYIIIDVNIVKDLVVQKLLKNRENFVKVTHSSH